MKRIFLLVMMFMPLLIQTKWKNAQGDCTQYGTGKDDSVEILNSTSKHVKVSISWKSLLCSDDNYNMKPWTCFKVKPGLCSMKNMEIIIDNNGTAVTIKKHWGYAPGTYKISEESGSFAVNKIASPYNKK